MEARQVLVNLRMAAKLLCTFLLWGVSHCGYASVDDDLIYAAKAGDVSRVRQLVAAGANVNATNKEGMTALHESLRYQFDDTNAYKPASLAGPRYLSIVKFLLNQGASVNSVSIREKLSPLHVATSNGFLDAVKLLIDSGAVVDARSETGTTPLLVSLRYPAVTGLLLSKGADVNSKTNNGWTALHWAGSMKDKPIVARLLLSNGADVNARTSDGRTPLHIAAKNQAEEVATLLISSGAEVNAKDNEGITPFDLARKSMKNDFQLLFLLGAVDTNPRHNCSTADSRNRIEWHVCRFPPLIALDSKLNDAYVAAMRAVKHPSYLRDEQREWIQKRNRFCTYENYECLITGLMRMYEERIEQLNQATVDAKRNSGKNLCIDLIQLADAKRLNTYAIRNTRAPTAKEFTEVSDMGGGQVGAIYELQLDRAKPVQRFGVFSTGGTCASTQVFNLQRLTQKDNASTGWVDVYDPNDIIRWAYWGGGDYPVEYGGQFFMVTADLADENRVNMISSIQSDGAILPICTVEEASFRYVPGAKSHSVCEEIASDAIRPVSWEASDAPLAPDRNAFVSKFGRFADSVATARIDLDGDGVKENIGRFAYSSGAGCGSEQAWGRVLANDSQSVVKGTLDHVISQLGYPFDLYLKAGVYYVRSSVSRRLDHVVRIRNGKAEKVCELHRKSRSRPKVLFELK